MTSARLIFPGGWTPCLTQVGDYRILREVGRGGMGVVYEAEQVSLGRRVALKVLPGRVACDRKALERFRREAKAAARLHHTNIVPVFEVGRDGDVAFYAMQFIQGQGLDHVIDELKQVRGRDHQVRCRRPGRFRSPGGSGCQDPGAGSASAGESRNRKLERVAESLLMGRLGTEVPAVVDAPSSEANPTEPLDPIVTPEADPRRGNPTFADTVPGSDVSSSAVLPGGTAISTIEPSSRRLPFFHSVAEIGRQAAQGLSHAHTRGILHRDIKPSNLLLDTAGVVWITDFGLAKLEEDDLTASGDILGTLRYMAPERFRGEGDARADVYALGMTLYELLTLRPAFDAQDRLNLIEQVKSVEPARPRAVDSRIPRDLETIVLKAIDKDPEARYPSAEGMSADLERFLADEPIRARQISAAERYWRWARRNPLIAVLGGALTGLLLLVTLGSLVAARRFQLQADIQSGLANARELERLAAEAARGEESAARLKADQANANLLASREELRRTVYATRSELALAAWETNDIGHLRSLLGLMRPDPGEADLRGWEWRYLWKLGHEDRFSLQAQEGDGFIDVAFSPDGQTLATLEIKGLIKFWDRHTGKLRRITGLVNRDQMANLDRGVIAIAFSPDGRTLAGPGPDASLVLYAVETGLPIFHFEGQPGAVLSLAWSPDGRILVAAISKHVLRVWDARDGHQIHWRFGRHDGPVAGVAFSPDGRTIASASFDHTVKLWKLDDPVQPSAVLEGHTDEVRAVAFSPDGSRVASAGLDQTVRVWDARSGAELAVIRGHSGPVLSLAYVPGCTRLVTGSRDQTVRVWDSASREELRTFKCTDAVYAVAVSPDGYDVASASDATAQVWDAASPPRPRTLRSPSLKTYGGSVECVAFSPDGERLVSGHDDDALRVWDLCSEQPPHILKGHTNVVQCVAFSPDGQSIASGSQDRTVRIWNASTGAMRLTYTGHSDQVKGLIFTADGQTLLSCGRDRTIQAWDPITGAVRYVLRGHTDTVNDLAFSPDGRTLASASSDKTCILWDLAGRQPRWILRNHAEPINAVAFSPDGKLVATGSSDRTVRLWDAASGSAQGILQGHLDDIDSIAFTADGRLASSGWDKTIRLWDPASRQTLLVLRGHAGRIRRIKFSPDGRRIASASDDRTLKLWEAAPAENLFTAAKETVHEP